MAKLSAKDQAELERLQAAAAAAEDDDDDEVEYGFKDGGYVRGKAGRVRKVVTSRGEKFDPDETPEDDTPEVKDDGKGKTVRFGRQVG